MAGVYDLKLGRIALPALEDDYTEDVGRALGTVGEAVIPGDRAPITSQLTLPIHGDEGEVDPSPFGDRMRRQVRSLLNNRLANKQIYFQATTDVQLNGFIAVGGGQVAYAPGGPTIGEYVLTINDAYRIGTLSSHRMAKEVRMFDRTQLTTPRDYRKTYFATGGGTPTSRHFFPIGATDIATDNRALSVSTVGSIHGSIPYVDGLANGEGVSFEIPEADILLGDVVIWDRRGFTSPSFTAAGDADPQDTANGYGWEEVYGPDYPLTVGDVPVIANGRCRVRWTGGGAFTVETSSGGAYGSGGAVGSGGSTLRGARVVEWTPDHGIIACDFSGGPGRVTTYITLRRGWAGPLVESYGFSTSGFSAPSVSGSGATDSGNGWAAVMVGASSGEYLSDSRIFPALAER
jgi:hypothetical protein